MNRIWNHLQRLFTAKPSKSWRRANLRRAIQLESLESRRVFATMVSGLKVSFQDKDGDTVMAEFSKPILTNANVNQILKFNTGTVNGDNSIKQQLQHIDLSNVENAEGVNVTLSVTKKAAQGDGLVHVGEINAKTKDIGNVSIVGDLGRIVVGDGNLTTVALKSLNIDSLGMKGPSTGAPSLVSDIHGTVNTISVAKDIQGARINATKLGSLSVGGSIRGNLLPGSGHISVVNGIDKITIGKDLIGSFGEASGVISTAASIGSIEIQGKVVGGSGLHSGLVAATNTITYAHLGSISGGAGEKTGSIRAGQIGNVFLDSSLTGGAGKESGTIVASGDILSVEVKNSIVGGAGEHSGSIRAQIISDSIVIGSVLSGGEGKHSGLVHAQTIKNVFVNGSIVGGNGESSGVIAADQLLSSVLVGNLVWGGSGLKSGSIRSDFGTIEKVAVYSSVTGGYGQLSGRIEAGQDLGEVFVGKHISGGNGTSSGTVYAGRDILNINVGGDVKGNKASSGRVSSGRDIKQLTISGNIIGGSQTGTGRISVGRDLGSAQIGGDLQGGAGSDSGAIIVGRNSNSLMIQGSVLGGLGYGSGRIVVGNDLKDLYIVKDLVGGSLLGIRVRPNDPKSLEESGLVRARHIDLMTVGGSIIAGTNWSNGAFKNNGAVQATDDIVKLEVHGDLKGNVTNAVLISARGSASPTLTADRAINLVHVHGNVFHTNIFAGMDVWGQMTNADAQITTIDIDGDWYSSNIIAGAMPGADKLYGTFDDVKPSGTGVKDSATIKSRIGLVYIGGSVSQPRGQLSPNAIEAETVGLVSIGGKKLALQAGASNDHVAVPGTKLVVREVGTPASVV